MKTLAKTAVAIFALWAMAGPAVIFSFVIAGVVAGSVVAWLVGRLVEGFLVAAVRPRPVVTILGVVALVSAATLVAAAVPARRAARLSPVEALRAE